jgi:hypothetical protein
MDKNKVAGFMLKGCSLVFVTAAWSFVLAQDTGPGQAVTWTAGSSELVWGPCPAFLPEGCGIAVLHGNPAEDNVDIFLRLPGKSELASHWHTSAERMVLVAGELHVTYEGQEMAVLKPGTYAYGPARKIHSGTCISTEPCVLFIAFESPLDAMPAAE